MEVPDTVLQLRFSTQRQYRQLCYSSVASLGLRKDTR